MKKDHLFELAENYISQTGISVFLTGRAGTGKTTLAQEESETRDWDDFDIFIGQRLLIIYVGNPVEDTATPTITPLPATNTPKPTATATETPLPLPTLTPTATMTPTPEPLIPHIRYFDTPGAKKLGLVLAVGSSIGLLVTIWFGFIRKK